jgi:hypothetical protein
MAGAGGGGAGWAGGGGGGGAVATAFLQEISASDVRRTSISSCEVLVRVTMDQTSFRIIAESGLRNVSLKKLS